MPSIYETFDLITKHYNNQLKKASEEYIAAIEGSNVSLAKALAEEISKSDIAPEPTPTPKSPDTIIHLEGEAAQKVIEALQSMANIISDIQKRL